MKDCANCGEPISAKRLKAVPDASYCITCQPLFDKQIQLDDALAVGGEIDRDFVAEYSGKEY